MKNSLSQLHTQAATPNYTVTHLSADDIPSAIQLIETIRASGKLDKQYHLKPKTADDLTKNLENGFPLLGIKSANGDLLAFAMICAIDDEIVMMKSVCVNLDIHLRGRGPSLVQAAENWATNNGYHYLVAKVATDNLKSLNMYNDQDFDKSLSEKDNEGYRYYYMYKTVKQAAPLLRNDTAISAASTTLQAHTSATPA